MEQRHAKCIKTEYNCICGLDGPFRSEHEDRKFVVLVSAVLLAKMCVVFSLTSRERISTPEPNCISFDLGTMVEGDYLASVPRAPLFYTDCVYFVLNSGRFCSLA